MCRDPALTGPSLHRGPCQPDPNPFPPSQKFLPDGKTQDLGEFINIDMTQVPAKSKQSVRKASIVSYPRDVYSFASDKYP